MSKWNFAGAAKWSIVQDIVHAN